MYWYEDHELKAPPDPPILIKDCEYCGEGFETEYDDIDFCSTECETLYNELPF